MASGAPVLDFVPVGFRFRPTDEELVGHYLKNKLMGNDLIVQILPEIDVCKHEPWDLPAFSEIESDDTEWFFFSPRNFKYSNSTRSNRATERGYWKVTGKDRNIKVRGTNDVIGTKKTLVFYEGRPHAVKTNWVIHEYHDAKFPVSQGTFVLCKLMKKPEKKAANEVCDEGEPSNLMASAYGNQASEDRIPDVHSLPEVNLELIFPMPPPADEYDFHFIQQSPIFTEQESPLQFPLLTNSDIGNDNSSAHFPFETTEEEDNPDELVNLFLADEEDVIFSEERRNALVNDSIPSESLRLYYESSDTDAEVISARYGNIPDTSVVSNKNAGSTEDRLMKMFKSSHGVEHAGTSRLSSNQEGSTKKKVVSFQDDFWGVDTSSADSTAARLFEVNSIEISSSPSTLKTCKTEYLPRSANSVTQRAGARRSQAQRKVSTKAASHHEAQKETLKESNSKQRKAQGSISRNTSEARSTQSSDASGRGSFIHMETPPLSQNLSPPSVYLVNVVLGLFLFIVIIWEIISCGKF